MFFELLPGIVFSAGDVKMNTQFLSFYLCSSRELLSLDILKDLPVFCVPVFALGFQCGA